ncbi:hypothetical protein L6164_003235 [Bauhinia variegata]|uniref:Uncharacterized protein n=1 Tax=Bauhinia variegata TaxID=167791 RepID=A0ACB9Q665_BAUVA|nr:hypothetical protein L6164_003235 [Bauhinia variegata]
MLEFLIEIATKIIECIFVFIWKQLCYVLFYKNNLNNLKGRVEDLEALREEIQHRVDAERRNGKTISTHVPTWQEDVEKVIQEAEQLQGNADHASVGCCPNLPLRHQLGRKAEFEAKNVGDLKIKGEKLTIAFDSPSQPDFTAYTSGTEMFESRMSIMNEILRAITAPNISMVGVYGLGGVGKTTLMYQVAAEATHDKSFDAVVKATVTKAPNVRLVQGQIADQLDLKLEKETPFGRAPRLRERIKREKSILIILDDIWERFDMNELGIPLGDHKGCKVLMTSRTQDVLNEMGCQKDFRLETLDESETWKLFQVMVGDDVVKDRRLKGIATQVANKCAGLPVLIVTVSRALKDKDIPVWKDALNRLTRVDNKDLREIYRSALELSYDNLEGNDMKELFLLCAAVSNVISDLFNYGMGLGTFKDVKSLEEARDRLHSMIDRLKASCLLLDDGKSTGYVKMHDNVREAAISIALRDERVFTFVTVAGLKEWPTERYTQIILEQCHIHELPEMLDNPELKLLHFNKVNANNQSLKIPDSFFEGVMNLKVLDLTRLIISSLPMSLSSLTKLKTLCLDRCALGGMAALASLKNIEILSLLNSSITMLPTEIGQLTRLRMLDLSSSGIELIPPNVISRLINLEEFYAGDTSIKWEAENATKHSKNASIAELSQLPRLTALDIQIQDTSLLPQDDSFLAKLERYKIFIGDKWTWSGIYDKHTNILKLKLSNSSHLGQGVRKLLEGVENLYLDEIKTISNGLSQLNFEGFLQLKNLRIQNNDEIRHIINLRFIQPHDAFPNLEVLDLYKLSKFEKICQETLTNISFQKLKVIKVKSCDQLKSVITSSMVRGLSQLQEIEVSECNLMKDIVFSDDNEMVIKFHKLCSLTLQHLPTLIEFYSAEPNSLEFKPLFCSKVAFYNLETLKLSSINLKNIWDDSQFLTSCCVQNLTNLTVEACGNIKYLFLSSTVGSFSKLKMLEISNCHEMEEIVAAEEGRNEEVNLAEVPFPKLEKMIINDMKNLEKIWHHQFGSLKTMEVKNCQNLGRIFPSHMQRKFFSLETIMVTGCSSLEEIFELNENENIKESKVNTQLRILTLLDLPNLKQIWSGDAQGILCFHNLETVRVENCPRLEYLFPLSIATSLPQLEEIFIKGAWYMKEFVAKMGGYIEESVKFEFSRLTTLIIHDLGTVDRFFAGNFSLHCPSLKILDVFNSPNLELYNTQPMSYPERNHDGDINVSTGQPFFKAEEVITMLEQLTLTGKDVGLIQQGQFPGDLYSKLAVLQLQNFDDEDATFPYWIFQKLPNLRSLHIRYCSFKEILHEGEKGQIEIATQLKEFGLTSVHKIQYLCKEGTQLDPALQIVEIIQIYQCSGLVYLVPSYVTFNHLTVLRVCKCNGLLYLITSSTARSLVQLIQLKVEECESLEEIVKEKGDDEMEQNIAFNNLRVLELKCLPRLKWFSSIKCLHWFPELTKVVVKRCPGMKAFSVGHSSTPDLENVEADEGWLCEDNLRTTIQKINVGFPVLQMKMVERRQQESVEFL